MTSENKQRVYIEFQRVQTWLFAVPRLKAMVGANALLGEVLRVKLPALAKDPRKAPKEGAGWSLVSEPMSSQFSGRDAEDPLADEDDPREDANAGILARDGGHFEAEFATGAEEFAKAASELLDQEIPGLRFSVTVNGVRRERAGASLSFELPVLTPCEWSGRGLASQVIKQGDDESAVSLDAKRRHDEARRASAGKATDGSAKADADKAKDLASLLTRTTKLGLLALADDFAQLVGDDYLAVIHADGNGVGLQAIGKSESEKAQLFHRNRVLIRRALKYAMDKAAEHAEKSQPAPLTLLMLGGDDVLVVCRASLALRFVVDLCQQLKEIQKEQAETEFRLTLGVGVVFSRPSVPFHRLHEVAEKLASSSKRLYRGMDKAARESVVDWATYTTAWADDPSEVRARDWVCGTGNTHRILSRRPLRVLGEGLDSLAGLLLRAQKLTSASRSQLHYLVGELSRGKILAELALAELSPGTKGAMKSAGVTEVWTKDPPYRTSILDLVEVLEIPRLGVTNKRGTHAESRPAALTDEQAKESAHGQAL
jgi:hypothetical protein